MKEMYMENVSDITANTMQHLSQELRKFSFVLNVRQEDELFTAIFNAVENLCKNDYKNSR